VRRNLPSWTGEVYITECFFPTWTNKEDAAVPMLYKPENKVAVTLFRHELTGNEIR
jgi:hypothetical protein